MHEQLTVGYGLCECGCGERTRIATKTDRSVGQVRGVPLRFVNGHNKRSRYPEYEIRCCGYKTPCWVWLRSRDRNGYGRIGFDLAHRAVWQRHRGLIPAGLQLDHLCRNPPCVNPDHLDLVTQAENLRRGAGTKLTVDDVRAIRASADDSQVIAMRYSINRMYVYAIRSRRVWRDVT